MAGVTLTSKAHCLDASCGWACEGAPAVVDKEAARHGKAFKHGTATWTHNPEAPVRTPEQRRTAVK